MNGRCQIKNVAMASKQRLTAADLSADGSLVSGFGADRFGCSPGRTFILLFSMSLLDVLDCEFLFNVYLLI